MKRVLTMMLALALLVLSLPAPVAMAEADGRVRVKLTRLGSRSTLTLSAGCAYYVNGDKSKKIDSGDKVSVSIAAGEVAVSWGGQKYSAKQLTLARGKTGDVGIRFISPSLSNVFCGDLILSASSGKILPVLRIFVEDYLYGVVGYEMSNSYPIEALKAQAVAARTFALANLKPSSAYDVTDDTNSQVFKGYAPSLTNVIRAVNETRGVCVMYNGKYAACYYGESNGGQVESAKNMWGGGAGYSVQKDDPYDLENPGSPMKALEVVKKPTPGKPLNAKLKTELVKALAGKLQDEDMKRGEGSVDIVRVNSITPISPRYPEPSRTFTKVRFSLDIRGEKEDGGEKALSDVKCDLQTYGNLKARFSLGFQSSDREIVSVADRGSSFAIEFRRFGHGVGMSQRGAQFQAKQHGRSYKDILTFYYVGVELVTKRFDDEPTPIASPADPDPAPDPQPADEGEIQRPAKLRTLKSGMKGQDVKLLQRRLKDLGYFEGSIGGNYQGLTIAAVKRFQSQLQIKQDGLGTTAIQRLIYAKSAPKSGAERQFLVLKTQTKPAGKVLKMRASAKSDAKIVAQIPDGDPVKVLSIGTKWCKIHYNGKNGYILQNQICFESGA